MVVFARTSKTADAVKTTALSISNIVIVGSLLTLSLLEPDDPIPDLERTGQARIASHSHNARRSSGIAQTRR